MPDGHALREAHDGDARRRGGKEPSASARSGKEPAEAAKYDELRNHARSQASSSRRRRRRRGDGGGGGGTAAATTAATQVAVAVSRYLSDSRAQSSTHHTSGISRFLSFGYSAPNFSTFHACVARARVPMPIQLKAAKAAGAYDQHAMP